MIKIKSRVTGAAITHSEAQSVKLALEGAVAAHIDLRSANLAGTDLRDAALRGAKLRDADLRDADLRGTDLRDADLQGAALQGAKFVGADLSGARIYQDITINAMVALGPIDGWLVLLFSTLAGLRLQVGCHFFSLEEAEAHWRYEPDRTHLYALVTKGWKTVVALAGWDEEC